MLLASAPVTPLRATHCTLSLARRPLQQGDQGVCVQKLWGGGTRALPGMLATQLGTGHQHHGGPTTYASLMKPT